MLIRDLVDRNARRYPNKTATVFESTRFTFGELKDRVCRFSNALRGLGIQKGDRVAVLMENCHEYFELYLAITRNGAVIVPLNYRLSHRELAYIVEDSGAGCLVCAPDYANAAALLASQVPQGVSVISTGTEGEGPSYEELVRTASPEEAGASEVQDGDLAYLMYTSGTTGQPKGVMLSQKNVTANAANQVWAYQYLEPDDVTVNVAPMYHTAAASISMAHFSVGATNVFLKGFDPKKLLDTVRRERITNFWAAPSMIDMLVNHASFGDADLASVRKISYAAAPMPAPLLRKCLQVIGPKFTQFYGLTEACPNLTMLPLQDHVVEGPPEKVRRLSSVGKEVLNVQVRVVNPRGDDVLPGEVGEVVATGDNVMMGYWKRPEATAEALRGGWLHTGDLATVDEEGYVYLVDRAKDLIISGGENIYPAEVERILQEHPAVREVAVIGTPDEVWGESVLAVVVPAPGERVSQAELIEFSKSNLASYKKPKRVEFVDALPRNASGKVLKRELRARFAISSQAPAPN